MGVGCGTGGWQVRDQGTLGHMWLLCGWSALVPSSPMVAQWCLAQVMQAARVPGWLRIQHHQAMKGGVG